MATLGELMDQMADTLLAAVGPAVAEVEVQVTPRRNFNPTPPSVDIYPGDPFRETGDAAGFSEAHGEMIFTVRARVTTADYIGGQDLLLRFMDEYDPISVAALLEEDQTLNGHASSVFVEGNSGYLQYIEGEGEPLLGCEWRVRVLRVNT